MTKRKVRGSKEFLPSLLALLDFLIVIPYKTLLSPLQIPLCPYSKCVIYSLSSLELILVICLIPGKRDCRVNGRKKWREKRERKEGCLANLGINIEGFVLLVSWLCKYTLSQLCDVPKGKVYYLSEFNKTVYHFLVHILSVQPQPCVGFLSVSVDLLVLYTKLKFICFCMNNFWYIHSVLVQFIF